jgi:menaquinone-dependent protoporphyrinogen oxidase
MATSTLIAYASRYGSTQEVAEVIAATLRERGLDLDMQPMRSVRTLNPYGAIVLGAPLYMFHWHKDARHFLARHRSDLIARPVALFALGPFHAEEQEFQTARDQLDKALAEFPWFTAAAIEVFGGRFDPEKLTMPYSLVPALKRMPASDARDWTAIRAWASGLVELLNPLPAQVSAGAPEGGRS